MTGWPRPPARSAATTRTVACPCPGRRRAGRAGPLLQRPARPPARVARAAAAVHRRRLAPAPHAADRAPGPGRPGAAAGASAEEYRRVLALGPVQEPAPPADRRGLLFLARADAEARRPALEGRPRRLASRAPRRVARAPAGPTSSIESDADGALSSPVHPPLLGELLNNLLDNAAKYSPPGTPIKVRLSRRRRRSHPSPSRRRPGIDRADLPHVFEPFFRAEAARLEARRASGWASPWPPASRTSSAVGSPPTVRPAKARHSRSNYPNASLGPGTREPSVRHACRCSGDMTWTPARSGFAGDNSLYLCPG